MGYIGSDPVRNDSVSTAQLADDAVTGPKIVDDIVFTNVTASAVSASGTVVGSTFEGTFSGALSSSAQIATSISGSFTAASSSFSTRVTRNEASASSLTTASSSFSTRMDNSEASGALMNQDLKTSASPTFADGTYTSNLGVSGSLTVKGMVTAEEFHTEFVSASIVYKSGSTKFGDTGDDEHQFTGSLQLSGSTTNESYIIGTNVGIGTTNPDKLVHISEGSSGATPDVSAVLVVESNAHSNISILSGNSSQAQLMFGDDGSASAGRVQYNHSDDSLVLYTAGAERMRISGSGNVGIGTTAPSKTLTVAGEVSSSQKIYIASGSTSTNPIIDTAGSELILRNTSDTDNNYAAITFQDAVDSTNISRIAFVGDDHSGNKGSFNVYCANGGSLVKTMRIANDAEVRFPATKKFGIGPTALAYELDVSGSTDDCIIRAKAPAGVGYFIADSGANTNAGLIIKEAGTTKWSIFNDGDASDKLTFEDDGDIRMVLQQDGNVGIGNTAPPVALTVEGAISASGGIVEQGGALKENLITNSGFDVWSNSTLENVGSALASADMESGAGDPFIPTNWNNFNADAGEISQDSSDKNVGDNSLHVNVDGAGHSEGIKSDEFTLTAGKLYKLDFDLKRTSGDMRIQLESTGGSGKPLDKSHSSGYTSWTDITYVFEATATDTDFTVSFTCESGAAEFRLDAVTLYEVTPGCVAADALACDGWTKDTTLDMWRQHDDGGTYTKDGSFYSLKLTPSDNTRNITYAGNINDKPEWYQRFAGRTIAFGAWVKTDTASHTRLRIYDGSYTNSSYHTGDDSWQWLEVSATVSSSTTDFRIRISADVDGETSYISQPMLVFGSSIGEGNYTRPVGEIVECETDARIWDNISISSDLGTINLEALSNGKIPKGAAAVNISWYGTASSAATNVLMSFRNTFNPSGYNYGNMLVSNVANQRVSNQGFVGCDPNGDVYHNHLGGTWSNVWATIVSIKLR